jgi:hypothetical protein
MAKGDKAKIQIAKTLEKTFGENWIGLYDKKYYVWANDNGEQVQIAITLTCPKTFIEPVDNATSMGDWDFSDNPKNPEPIAVSANTAPAEISEEELDNIAKALQRLGL